MGAILSRIVLAPGDRFRGGPARIGTSHSSTTTNEPRFTGSRFAREPLT
jgi:hypothetical protein